MTNNRNVLYIFPPYQAVMPVAVAKILVFVRLIGFGRIISRLTFNRNSPNKVCSIIQEEGNITFEAY